MHLHSDLPAFRPGLDEHPDDDDFRRLTFADFLDIECEGDPRGPVVRAACTIRERLGSIAFPDRFDAFWTQSKGWEQVGKQLEQMAAQPEDTAAFRHQYERLVRGDVPLDPEHLDQTLRLQYDLQVRLLESLNLLEEEDDDRFLTAIDGKRYPLPAFEDVQARMQTPELQTKLRQGFDTLLLVPFGLPLERFTEALREGLKRNAGTLRGVGAFNQNDPLWMWDQYQREPLAYDPRSFTDDHGGKTKEQLLAEGHRGWDVLLVEGGLQNLPRVSQGQTIGGRPQIECNRTPTQYLTDLRLRGESGLTPEAYVLQFLDTLERRGQVLDIQTFSSLTGSFLPASRSVPCACWGPQGGQANLYWVGPGGRHPDGGVRAAVRVR
jgi:hypothetical protein